MKWTIELPTIGKISKSRPIIDTSGLQDFLQHRQNLRLSIRR